MLCNCPSSKTNSWRNNRLNILKVHSIGTYLEQEQTKYPLAYLHFIFIYFSLVLRLLYALSAMNNTKSYFQCSSLEAQNSGLIQNLEMERQHAANTVKNLEAKLRELQEALMTKVRELGLAYNAHLPLDLELDAFATLLEAEERRYCI